MVCRAPRRCRNERTPTKMPTSAKIRNVKIDATMTVEPIHFDECPGAPPEITCHMTTSAMSSIARRPQGILDSLVVGRAVRIRCPTLATSIHRPALNKAASSPIRIQSKRLVPGCELRPMKSNVAKENAIPGDKKSRLVPVKTFAARIPKSAKVGAMNTPQKCSSAKTIHAFRVT